MLVEYKILNGTKIWQYQMKAIASNMYIIISNHEALIIDPHICKDAKKLLIDNGVEKVLTLLTHEHYDHISGVNWLRDNFTTTVLCNFFCGEAIQSSAQNLARYWEVLMMDRTPEEQAIGKEVASIDYACKSDGTFDDAYDIIWNEHSIFLKHTPGHSKGSCIIRVDSNILFTGDSLVNGVGIVCRLPGGSWKQYCNYTLPYMEKLQDDILICPGHGNMDYFKKLKKYLVKYVTNVEEN